MKVTVFGLILLLAKVTWAQAQATTSQTATVAAAPAEAAGYANCSNRKYNHAYGENTITVAREKDDRYLVRSSKFLKKEYPLLIKGWISENDCKPIMLKVDSPLEIEAMKDKTLLVKAKAKLKLNRIYFISQDLPSTLFRNTYAGVHVSNLSDEKKRKSTLTGLVIGTQIYANSIFRLSLELQNDSWSDKATSATTNIFFLGFGSCAAIDSMTGTLMKVDLCAKLLAGKSSDPNLHIKYGFSPQLNFDFTKTWRFYTQAGLVSVISRSEGFSDNAFGMDIEAGLAYRF